jgi:hypothetical protein
MAQADQTVQNATFPTVRADINNNLAALFSDNSGSTAPSVTVAFQDWIDTSGASPLWKKRNAANNAWITLGTISASTIAFEGTLPSQTGNAGEYLTTDGTVASWASITAAGQLLRAPQVLTSGVSYTAPANCTSIYVEAIGGGGGGGGTNGWRWRWRWRWCRWILRKILYRCRCSQLYLCDWRWWGWRPNWDWEWICGR